MQQIPTASFRRSREPESNITEMIVANDEDQATQSGKR
jgi:hypothetical protein